jgi:N-acetylglucosamine-6-sulfatase
LILLLVISLSGCTMGQTQPPKKTISVEVAGPTATPLPTARVTILPKEQRPNLIVILTDDLDLNLGTIDYMSTLQAELVNQGISFQHFLVADSVCCPSRVTFLRGQYGHNHQVYTNVDPSGSFTKFYTLGSEASTLATWLQAAGYRTVFLGKYLNGYPDRDNRTYIPPGWNEWYSPDKGKPYVGLRYEMNENGSLIYYDSNAEDYLTDVLARKAVKFIEQSANTPNPIFVYLSTYAPHEPARPAERHAESLPGLMAPRTPSFNEEDVSDKPFGISSDPPLTGEQIYKLDELYRARAQTMLAVDEMIADVFKALKESGRLDNSYIIFTSDNGFHLGQHRMKDGKASPYEEDIHVPFIVRGPGVPNGKVVSDYIAGNIDFAPTLADLAGVIPPDFVDGRSLVPFLHTQSAPESWRKAYLVEHYALKAGDENAESSLMMVEYSDFPGTDGKPSPNQTDLFKSYAALVTKEYKYVEYADGFRELYDLQADPYELENQAASADLALIDMLSAWLHSMEACAGTECRQVEEEAP